jgi:hypothetical protein
MADTSNWTNAAENQQQNEVQALVNYQNNQKIMNFP